MNIDESKKIIGRTEWCAFPMLGIPAIKARIDSGAKTSSIHAFNIRAFRRDGQEWVGFEVHPLQKNRRTTVQCECPVIDERKVKSSSGIATTRYVVRTTISLGGENWDIELTLANRDPMGYRMLLGREAMSGRLVVDPEHSFLQGKLRKSKVDKMYGKVR